MANLDAVLQMLGSKEAVKESTIIHRFDENELSSVKQSMMVMTKNLQTTIDSLVRFKKDMDEKIEEVISKVDEIEKNAQGLNEGHTDDVLKAIKGIKMPTIPKQEKVDLSGVVDAIHTAEMQTLLALKNVPKDKVDLSGIERRLAAVEKSLDKPKEWVFDVERDVVNDIQRVVARGG